MSARRARGIPRRSEGAETPLSFAQQRLWYLDQIDPGLTAYTIPRAFRIEGPLDVGALQRALGRIVERHEVLRTCFSIRGDTPYQEIAESWRLDLPVVDLTGLEPEAREARLEELCQAEAGSPFALSELPLIRARLFSLAQEEHVLFLMVHHIVFDGASIGLFLEELGATYDAFAAGEEPPLDELPVQYADYAIWERDALSGVELEKRLAHWREALAGAPAAAELPTARTRPARQTFVGADRFRRLPEGLLERLKPIAAAEGATLFILLLAAFKALLFRYTGQGDVVVGSPSANRNRLEVERLVGFFVNDLVLRTRFSGEDSFRELLRSVRATCLGAYRYQDLPFERLVQEMRPERDLSRTPLFQIMFDYQGAAPAPRMRGLDVRVEPVRRSTSHFDLTLVVEAGEDGAVACANYNTDLFEAETIDALLGHLETLLEGVASDPDLRLSKLPLLTEPELRRAVTDWNRTVTGYPEDRCVHELIEERVREHPDAAAAVFRNETVTYDELNRRANRLASRLAAMGVEPGVRVGVFMERSLDTLTALLAVLKAGGAYVPLDPGYPRRRLEIMLEDSGATVVLTHEALRGSLPPGEAAVLALDSDRAAIEAEPDADLGRRAAPDDLAYVMYTSGSTGRPKGVMVRHRNVVNFFAGMDQRIGGDGGGGDGETAPVEPGVWLAVTSISFDISVLELFWTLARGFKVVLQPDESVASIRAMGARRPRNPTRFSLFYFSADEEEAGDDKYRLLIEGAKFADAHGFEAVWTPERHFHSFGGLYPNPSVVGAALAVLTERVKLRAGSVVLPLHDPIRVAEEWSVVDNLSGGRVGLSIASGWHDRDFVLAPERFEDRREVMFRGIDTLKALWRGESVSRESGSGEEIEVGIRPRPIQDDLPIWVTASGSPDTFRRAGTVGANMLTHLLGQSVDELAEKIRVYRQALEEAGHGAEAGTVTLMLHAFVGSDPEAIREVVKGPFQDYLRTAVNLIGRLAEERGQTLREASLSEEDMGSLLDHAFDRYYETSALFGTPESCQALVDRLAEAGVDEIACLVDFGIDVDTVLDNLEGLARLAAANAASDSDDAEYTIARQIDAHGVTHLQCTPSQATMLMASQEDRRALGALRRLMIGGEAMPPVLAEQLLGAADAAEIHNMYGPTETTIWSSTHHVEPPVGRTVSIGRPIANTQLYVLDPGLEPAPVGVPGELYIGGDGVTAGYLGDPDHTESRFVPDPFSESPAARLFRTGDMVRQRRDGSLEFMGRIDGQIKLRGHRIELGEIESALAGHPGVREAVAVVREDVPGDARLFAYWVPAGEAEPEETLIAWLRESVPGYMVPSRVVRLEAFPLTPNGKVDRKALPAPEATRGSEARFVAPRTPVEEAVAEIFGEILGVGTISVEDDFFDLGGHSLSAVQLGLRLRETFKVNLSMLELFEGATVARLSGLLLEEEPVPGQTEKIAGVLARVRGMSSEEARALLEEKRAAGSGG